MFPCRERESALQRARQTKMWPMIGKAPMSHGRSGHLGMVSRRAWPVRRGRFGHLRGVPRQFAQTAEGIDMVQLLLGLTPDGRTEQGRRRRRGFVLLLG